MKRMMILISVLALLMLFTLAPTLSVVHATEPITVNGFMGPGGGGGSHWERDPAGNSDNVIAYLTGGTSRWTGDIEAFGSVEARYMNHNFGTPEQWTNHEDFLTLDAVFDGKTGTLTIKNSFGGGDTGDGNWRIISGTGELANLHGEGKFHWIGVYPTLWSYTGQVHFDP